jgi:hypothetical protein
MHRQTQKGNRRGREIGKRKLIHCNLKMWRSAHVQRKAKQNKRKEEQEEQEEEMFTFIFREGKRE